MPDRIEYLQTRLRDEGAATLDFFRGLPAEAWSSQVYDSGSEWDVRQVLCHFVSAEESLTKLFARIIETGEGSPVDFDIDRWNAGKVSKMAELTSTQLIAEFERTRAASVAWVGGLDDAVLNIVGRHPFLGDDNIESMLKLLYRHNKLHQRDVRKALDTGQPVPPSD